MEKYFDLNIEKVLDNWELKHAVREIIANALDEQILTNTSNIQIYKENGEWHIRDFGRGIKYLHFTQNENDEKTKSINLIGKFGVGLKDALGVFFRRKIRIRIDSKFAHITLEMHKKSGFEVETLHAKFDEPLDYNFVGTDFVIENIDDQVIYDAKSMFLCFNNETLLESTKYGEVYKTNNNMSSIYVNGVQVATEDNFLFSYNITNANTQIKRALNRERTNVGRTAYAETIKNILTQCEKQEVLMTLVKDLENVMRGTNKDETNWVDVAVHAAMTLNKSGEVVFVTPLERSSLTNQQVEILNDSGKNIVLITDNVYNKIQTNITTFKDVYKEYSNSFRYEFVDIKSLNAEEKYNFENILKYAIKFLSSNGYDTDIEVKISNTIKTDEDGKETKGAFDKELNKIIIKRSVLKNTSEFAGTLIHEFVHYFSGFSDNSRDFENELTDIIGLLISNYID